jgi:hypothetical protein
VQRKYILGLLLLGALFFVWSGGNRLLVAKALSPPRAPSRTVIKTAIHPAFQIATPHRSFFREIKLTFLPSVHACEPPQCNGMEDKSYCGNIDLFTGNVTHCPEGFCYCPGCSQTPGCVVYICMYTGRAHRICTERNGTNPCTSCRLDDTRTSCVE